MRLPFDQLRPSQRYGALVALGALVAGAVCIGLYVTASRPLTAPETARFALWVELTGDPAVTQAYVQDRRDGKVTVAEARAIMELAKSHPPPYGLAGDGR